MDVVTAVITAEGECQMTTSTTENEPTAQATAAAAAKPEAPNKAHAAARKPHVAPSRLRPTHAEKIFNPAWQNNLAAKAQVQAAKAGVETARAQIQAANAAVVAATAAVATAQLNLGFTRLLSPIDGIAGIAQQEYLDFNRRFPTQASRDAITFAAAAYNLVPMRNLLSPVVQSA
jgi:multidrug efflux pump subunit AcrA (membrane-fusion protein)